jgi:hypothetical protein
MTDIFQTGFFDKKWASIKNLSECVQLNEETSAGGERTSARTFLERDVNNVKAGKTGDNSF